MKRALLIFIPAIVSAMYGRAQTITTIAGIPPGMAGFVGDGGPATAGKLVSPQSIVKDAAGNIYIADAGNFRIRKISTAGVISTVAGTGTPGYSGDGGAATAAQLLSVMGICIDASGNLYIADMPNNRIRKISTAGIITTVAGNGTTGYAGDGGPATAAELKQPADVAIDGGGTLYIADKGNHCIRKVSGGTITTIAGNPVPGSTGDGGAATDAELNTPTGICVAGGNIYIADQLNGRIRKINASGIISTVAGNGTLAYTGDGGPATAASLYQPSDVHADAAGNMWISDMVNNRIRKVGTSGTINTLAGTGTGGFGGDGMAASTALINAPAGIFVDAGANVYFADQTNNRVRTINGAGIINTISGVDRYIGDGGPATNAELLTPQYLVVDKHNTLYFAETNGHRVRKITPDGMIHTIAGTGIEGVIGMGDGSPATTVDINRPEAIAVDTAGNVYFTEFGKKIRMISATGILSTYAGTGTPSATLGDGGPAIAAAVAGQGLHMDTVGNLYVSTSGYHSIRRIDPAGIITTIAGTNTGGYGGDGGPAVNAEFNYPYGMRTDKMGNLFVADQMNSAIRKITPAGDIFTVAGNGTPDFSGDGGPATAAQLKYPQDVQTLNDTLIIADGWNARVRMVDAAGNITTIAGNGTAAHSGDGGPATAASMWFPFSVALGNDKNTLYIVDIGANVIRKVSNVFNVTPTTSINQPYTEVRTRVFPNPVVNEVRLYANSEIKQVAISNMLRQQVMTRTCNGKNAAIDVAHLPPGMYLIRINNSETQKFVKE